MTTLEQHLDVELRRGSVSDPAIGAILGSMAMAARALAREVRGAAIAGHTGLAGERNVTGDAQKKLDVIGNTIVLEAVASTRLVAAVVSEELAEAERLGDGHYVLCADPLDGSSNTDINGAVGTIFGLYRRTGAGPVDPTRDLLRAGVEQVLAGYVMYGPSTLLVYTAGHGAHGFTLDVDRDEFVVTHANIRCPARGACLSANLARLRDWHPGIQEFVASVTGPATGGRPPWSLRYTGALVADVHRSLIEGGIYFYPSDPGHPDGKLRLLYECAPLAFVVEQAGGAASTGSQRMLDVRATKIHQRVPLVIGSVEDVALFETFVAAHAADA